MLYVDMLKGVLGEAKGCPEGVAASAMRETVAEFLTRTRCMLGDDVIATTGTVPAVADMLSQVVDVVDASIEGKPVLVTFENDPEVNCLRPGYFALTFKDPSGDLTLTPTPAASVNLRLWRIFSVGPESTQVADWVWLRHNEALKHGCLARLLAKPDKPWTNAATSVYHDGLFQAAITQVAVAHGINRKQVARRLRVKPA